MKTYEDIKKLSEEQTATEGKFTASRDGKLFLKSDFLFFANWGEDYAVIGSQKNERWITFSLPTDLKGLGPHKVPLYEKNESLFLVWEVRFEEERLKLKSGSVTFTFKDESRNSIAGSLDFVLEDDSKVHGDFNIWN